MVKIKIDMGSLREVQQALAMDAEGVGRAAKAGVRQLGEDILAEADQIVPFDTDVLAGSRAMKETHYGDKYTVEVGYGNSSVRYALVQHERLDFYHPPKPPNKSKVGGRQGTGPGHDPVTGRGPKYLEMPFKRQTQNIEETLVGYIRAHYKLGGK
jgi:hypothetical protein